MARPNSVNVDTVKCRATRGILPSAAQQLDRVAALRDAAENLVEVQLCSATLRILTVLPVQNENAH
jgi:hypothetical protein